MTGEVVLLKVKMELKVSANEFFSFLVSSIALDVKTNGDMQDFTEENIKAGFSYVKPLLSKLGRQGMTTVTIEKYEPPNVYSASFTSSSGINKTEYIVDQTSDGCIQVVYSESFEGANIFANINYKIMSFALINSAKNRALANLKAIEEHIAQERE